MRQSLIGGVAYLAVMTLWIYGVANRWDPGSGTWQVPILILIQLLAGLVIGGWWAVLLPVVIVLVSIPAGDPPITPAYVEPFPIWFGLAVATPVAIALIALAVVARKIYIWRSGMSRVTT